MTGIRSHCSLKKTGARSHSTLRWRLTTSPVTRTSLTTVSLSAVATVPDARKGEKLILITEAPGATRADFLSFAKANGAMDLMVPAEVRVVPKVPVLGSGKLDFAGVTKMVRDEEAMKTKAA